MERDGDGWVECDQGHRHWGVHGAAGLLLHAVDDDGVARVLLQHRAAWSHHGDTWGLPGGARDSHEDVVATALREAAEEAGLGAAQIRPRHTFVDDHGGWSYTTVLADVASPVPTVPNGESTALEWVPVATVADMPLHPGFALTWPSVRALPTVLLVDAANVVGSRPDGWWRDRAGAASRLLASLAGLRAATIHGPGEGALVIGGVVVVLEGAANAAEDPEWVRVHRARGKSGDDLLVEAAAGLLADGADLLVVTADRGLRERLRDLPAPAGGLDIVGPRWLLHQLDDHTEHTAPRRARQ